MDESRPVATELSGCIPILCTPFAEDGGLDLPSLEAEVAWVLGEGARGVACLAIASEGYKLTEGERDEVVRTVVAAVGGRVPVVVSAGAAGTDPAVERARRATRLGADALMVLPPSFVKPDAEDLAGYYRRVAAAAGAVDVIVQDAPQLTGVVMPPPFLARLNAEIPNLRYVKMEGMPQGETISATLALSSGRLRSFSGWGGLGILDALERGAIGSMPAPNFTRLFATIQDRYDAGDIAGAATVFATELPFLLWTMQSVDHSVAAAKEELRQRGLFGSAHRRQPAARLDDVARAQLARFLDARLA